MLFLQSFIVLLIILSTSMMYGLLIIFITLVVGCQPLDSANAVQSIKPTKQISILKFPIIPKQSSKDNNILKKVLSYDPAIELLTNKGLNLPQKWYHLNAQYHALPLKQQKQIQEFYKKNQYSSVWYNKQGILRKNVKKMQNTLNQEIYLTTPIEGDYIQISEKKYQIKMKFYG